MTDYYAREIDTDEYPQFCDLVNDGEQLSWELTPAKLEMKLGSRGMAFGLFTGDGQMVGTIAIKHDMELGYLYIDPAFRAGVAVKKLFDVAADNAGRYDFLFMTTRQDNRVINRLLEYSHRIVYLGTAESLFSHRTLNIWIVEPNESRLSIGEISDRIGAIYGHVSRDQTQ